MSATGLLGPFVEVWGDVTGDVTGDVWLPHDAAKETVNEAQSAAASDSVESARVVRVVCAVRAVCMFCCVCDEKNQRTTTGRRAVR